MEQLKFTAYKLIKFFSTTNTKLFKYVILACLVLVVNLIVLSAQSNSACGVTDGFYNSITKSFTGTMFVTMNDSGACQTMTPINYTLPNNVSQSVSQLNANPNAYRDGGALGMLAQVTDYASTSVSDSKDVTTFVASKLNPQAVSAQSSALQGLSPILVIWGVTRNITYILLAMALVVTGIVLYFGNRAQGGKGNSATTGLMVSEIVATLVFITLSYPIGAIIVDLVINLGNGVIASTFNPFINSNTILANLYTPGSGANILNMIGDLQRVGVSQSTTNLLQSGLQYLKSPLTNAQNFLTSLFNAPTNGNPVANVANLPASILFGTLVSIYFGIAQGIANQAINNSLIIAVISFTVFILIFRIVFLLLGSFVGIILTIGFSPFILVSGAFPGTSTFQIFTNWIRRLMSLAVVFPITFALLLLSAIFLNLQQSPNKYVSADGKTNDCVYQQGTPNPVNIIGTAGTSSNPNEYTNTNSNFFDTQRFPDNSGGSSTSTAPTPTPTPGSNTTLSPSNDENSKIRKCFPILLPPKFNWLPAPIGNFGNGFEVDDFTRFVLGLAFIIIIPSVTKIIQDALKIKTSATVTLQDALAGAGLLGTFVGQIPFVGKPISQVVTGITNIAK